VYVLGKVVTTGSHALLFYPHIYRRGGELLTAPGLFSNCVSAAYSFYLEDSTQSTVYKFDYPTTLLFLPPFLPSFGRTKRPAPLIDRRISDGPGVRPSERAGHGVNGSGWRS
jgi:hypothetical protein